MKPFEARINRFYAATVGLLSMALFASCANPTAAPLQTEAPPLPTPNVLVIPPPEVPSPTPVPVPCAKVEKNMGVIHTVKDVIDRTGIRDEDINSWYVAVGDNTQPYTAVWKDVEDGTDTNVRLRAQIGTKVCISSDKAKAALAAASK